MTWEMLERVLASVGGTIALDPLKPAEALHHLEALADKDPIDRRVAAAIRALHDSLLAGVGLDPVVGGIHRERLVAWNAWDATWIGSDTTTGSEGLVRTLRPDLADPVRTRCLARDARALADLVPGLRSGTGWIAAPAPGTALPDRPTSDPARLARIVSTGLAALTAFEQTGQWPVLADEQWRVTDTGLVLVALETRSPGDVGGVLAWFASRLLGDVESSSPLTEALAAIVEAPPRTAAVGSEVIEHALATDLAARRHDLFHRRRETAHGDRVARLLDAVQRMERALPHPLGRGAIGVDLEGNPTAIEGRREGLWWGPLGSMIPVWTTASGFDAPEARRLLRARAAAPPTDRLQREVEGDAAFTDAAGRWVAAGLKARTIRMLLERELSSLCSTESHTA